MLITEHPAVDRLKEDLAQIEEKVVLGYTLADAIREGSTVTGQKIGGWYTETEACALSAAHIAAQARGLL
jgi:hypothetical protein